MDDQFGGRTDDDLFADEFEPVLDDVPQSQPEAPTFSAPPVANEPPPVASPSPSTAPNSVVEAAPAKDVAPSTFTPSEPKPGSGLAQSRFAQQPPADTPRAPRSHRANQSSNKPHHNNNNNNNGSSNNNSNNNQAVASPAPSSPAPHQPKPHENRHQNPKTGPGSGARAGSGANPRTKLSEAELVEKMEKMRILNAEKTERFKRAEADEHSHAIALEKASVEAKKRRQEEAERRKLEATNRRQMDDERERNRQRKLNALGVKENSWDEGKEERLEEEDRRRGGNFRGANGGIRGAASGRGGGGLSGSRFADATSDTDFMTGRGGSARGRGGRGGGRGRGGRGDYFGTAPPQGGSPAPAKAKEASLKVEDFPELPSSSTANKKTASVAKADLSTPTSPLGKWDDEMEALDAKAAAATES